VRQKKSYATLTSDRQRTHLNFTLNQLDELQKPRDVSGRFVSMAAAKKKLDLPVDPPVLKFEADFIEKVDTLDSSMLSFRKPFDRVENNSRILA
jgi:hypothetical protein